MTDERIPLEDQRDTIMKMIYELCESLIEDKDDGEWIPVEVQHQIAAIERLLNYALALETS